ncbi:MAG: hypothetical protein L3J47_00780 [Sulfurovum sp.]|nr:hypothetical protein [Sulfurovum sp.]
MKKFVVFLVFLFSMLSGNEVVWKQNISDGVQYHIKCDNGEPSDVFYYNDSERYFVGGIGNYATLDSAKQNACKTPSHIITIKVDALLLPTLKSMKHALRNKAFWNLEHWNAKTILNKSVNAKLLKVYHIKGKKVAPESDWHYIDDIIKISDGSGNVAYVRKSEVIF